MRDEDDKQPTTPTSTGPWIDVARYAGTLLNLLHNASSIPDANPTADASAAPDEDGQKACIGCGKILNHCEECESDADTLVVGEYVTAEDLTEQLEGASLNKGDGEEIKSHGEEIKIGDEEVKADGEEVVAERAAGLTSPVIPAVSADPATVAESPSPASSTGVRTPTIDKSPATESPATDKSTDGHEHTPVFPVRIPPTFVIGADSSSPLRNLPEQIRQFLENSSGSSPGPTPGSPAASDSGNPNSSAPAMPGSNTHPNTPSDEPDSPSDAPPAYPLHTQIFDVDRIRLPPTRTRRRTVRAPARIGEIDVEFQSVITRYPHGGWRRERVIRTRSGEEEPQALDVERLREYVAQEKNPWHDYKRGREE
ncbi:hypothetical protein A1Q2_04684 [Trichosporon asahii var. asahii CBS 8904]|uniref:Uncharacterized protein n=1 Tax=Trichosporon asahii var. asahii (strain CBS 8904) TaxID=1220162 RepID=K1VNF0_TRIAC|nr:hypothetical protein A1Q2_04684 [Trichosporon asahii var. asahii CBS 8904]